MLNNASDAEETLSGDEKIVAEAKRRFRQCEDWEGNARNLFCDDVKFANGDSDNLYQWPNSVRKNREIDERPCLTINKVRQHNLQIMNDARQNKSSPTVRPVGNGATFDSAQVFESIFRHIEYISNAQDAYTVATKFQVEGGIGYWRVVTDYMGDDTFDQEIFIRRVRDPLTIFLDPDILEKDGSDARFGFVFDDMPKDEFDEAYPQYKDLATQSALDNTGGWVDKDHVRVAEYYRRVSKEDKLIAFEDPETGERIVERVSKLPKELVDAVIDNPITKHRLIFEDQVEWYLIIGSRVAEEKKWPGRYIPIIRVIGEETIIDGTLDRKGHTRNMKDPQRMYNYWTSNATEQLALQSKSPYVAAVSAIEGYETYWDSANKVNYSVLPYNHLDDKGNVMPPPSRQDPPVMASGYLAGMQTAKEEMMMASGQYEATFGQKGNEVSGKAINARERQGDNATYHFADNFASAQRFTGKILLDLIPKIYDTPRIVKIMADDNTETHIMIDPHAKQAYQEQQNENEEKITAIFNPNVGKYDVMSDVGPSYATKRQEAFNALSQIMAQNPQTAMMIGDLWADNSDFPTANKIAERFRNMLPPAAKGEAMPPEVQQMQAQMDKMQGLLEKTTQDLAMAKITLKGKDQQKEIDMYKAITDRLGVLEKHIVTPRLHAEFVHNLATQEHASDLAMAQAEATAAQQEQEQPVSQALVGKL